MAVAEQPHSPLQPVYEWAQPVVDKITAVATQIYGAREVVLTAKAKADLKDIERLGFAGLPICIAKTQSSLSDLLLFELEEAPGVPFDDVVEVSSYVAGLEHGLVLDSVVGMAASEEFVQGVRE